MTDEELAAIERACIKAPYTPVETSTVLGLIAELRATQAELYNWKNDKPTACRIDPSNNCATILACHIICSRFYGTNETQVTIEREACARIADAEAAAPRRENTWYVAERIAAAIRSRKN